MLQASSVVPWLKEHGYRVTINTDDRGYEVIKHDPNIDEAFVQRQDQVPNSKEELFAYWDKLATCFTKFVQFTGSIEGGLLALPGTKEYNWNTRPRHVKMNKDYFKRMHSIAQVPLPPRPKFYPTPEEADEADWFLDEHGKDNFFIMWCLCGSSLHKAWPHTDQVVARLLLEHPQVKIVFVGDTLCQILEYSWELEPRVIRTSGIFGIRESLSLSQKVDMVVGPETGVLNCVAFEAVLKVILLSHSSPVNIGGTWANTEVLNPIGVDCYPCHKMHYGWSSCNRDEETGGAVCAAAISADRVYDAIVKHIKVK